MPAPAPLLPLAARFSRIVNHLVQQVDGRIRGWPAGWPQGLIPPVLAALACRWLIRRRGLVVALIERIRAGKLRPPRPWRPRAGPQDTPPRPPRPPPDRLPDRLPREVGWLNRYAQEVGGTGAELSALTTDPQMREMAAATPRMGELLRPMLRMLGQPIPQWLAAPPRPRRRRPPRPPPEEGEPLPPLDRRYATVRRWRRDTVAQEGQPPRADPPAVTPPASPPAWAAPPVTPPARPPDRAPDRPRGPWRNFDFSR